jgi:hypothetical protein
MTWLLLIKMIIFIILKAIKIKLKINYYWIFNVRYRYIRLNLKTTMNYNHVLKLSEFLCYTSNIKYFIE